MLTQPFNHWRMGIDSKHFGMVLSKSVNDLVMKGSNETETNYKSEHFPSSSHKKFFPFGAVTLNFSCARYNYFHYLFICLVGQFINLDSIDDCCHVQSHVVLIQLKSSSRYVIHFEFLKIYQTQLRVYYRGKMLHTLSTFITSISILSSNYVYKITKTEKN